MTNKQFKTIHEGLEKIVKCYESNYRDYILKLGIEGAAGHEKFEERMKVVDRMRDNWLRLIEHYINLEYESYYPTNDIDSLDRRIRANKWKIIICDMLSTVSNHWSWLCNTPEAVRNLLQVSQLMHK